MAKRKKPKIFVSHSSEDSTFAAKLVEDLNAAGAQAWLDVNDLGAGSFPQGIDAALARCEFFLLVLTRNAQTSMWVNTEVYAAIHRHNERKIKDLIFIKAAEIDRENLSPMWAAINWFDATKDYFTALNQALRIVGLRPAENKSPVVPDTLPQSVNEHQEGYVGLIRRNMSAAGLALERSRFGSALANFESVIMSILDLKGRLSSETTKPRPSSEATTSLDELNSFYKQALQGKAEALYELGRFREAEWASEVAETLPFLDKIRQLESSNRRLRLNDS